MYFKIPLSCNHFLVFSRSFWLGRHTPRVLIHFMASNEPANMISDEEGKLGDSSEKKKKKTPLVLATN